MSKISILIEKKYCADTLDYEPLDSLVSSSAQVAAPLVSGGPVIRLPEAGLVLTKLPPIRDTVSLPPAPQVGCGWSAVLQKVPSEGS